eukprot:scaffold1220_cov259-Pinguiococcus_pyrenoidosus.AAC.46
MKGDKELVGTLRGFDNYVNMVLEDVTEYEVRRSTPRHEWQSNVEEEEAGEEAEEGKEEGKEEDNSIPHPSLSLTGASRSPPRGARRSTWIRSC